MKHHPGDLAFLCMSQPVESEGHYDISSTMLERVARNMRMLPRITNNIDIIVLRSQFCVRKVLSVY